MAESRSLDINIIVLGANGCGKTRLSLAYTLGTFEKFTMPCVNGFKLVKHVEWKGRKICVNILDSDGREYGVFATSLVYRHADAIIVCYDVTDVSSFLRVGFWSNIASEYTHDHNLFYLVGCKSDLKDETVITTAEGKEATNTSFLNNKGVKFFETSAKTHSNVDELFDCIISDVMSNGKFHQHQRQYDQQRRTVSLTEQNESNQGKCSC